MELNKQTTKQQLWSIQGTRINIFYSKLELLLKKMLILYMKGQENYWWVGKVNILKNHGYVLNFISSRNMYTP